MGEVGGPNRGAAGTARSGIDADFDLAALHIFRAGGFQVIGVADAFARDLNIAEPDREAVPVGCFARFANGRNDPAPVGVLARNRGLNERRVADGERNLARGGIVFGALDMDGHQLRNAFAILYHLHRQVAH